MHEGLSARSRALGCVIAVTAMLAALALPLTAASTSWAEQSDGSAAAASVAGDAAPAELPAAAAEALAPITEPVPAAGVAQAQEQTSAAPAADVAEQAVPPSAAVDAGQSGPAPVVQTAPAPEVEGAPAPAASSAETSPVSPASDAAPGASGAGVTVPIAPPTPEITCISSAFYAVSSDGVVQQVIDGAGTNDATFETVGSWSLESPSVDGLAVAGGGAAMYAVDVTATGVDHVLSYTAAAGWGAVPSSFEHGNTEPLAAGAVDLATGRYYVGGYHITSMTTVSFRLYSVDVRRGDLALVGQFSTGLRPGDLSTGDMAFDAAGNLYVLHGSHDGGVIFSIAASELADPGPGGELAASASVRLNLNGLNEGNGIAFSATGTAYIVDPHHVRQFVPGTWDTPDNLVTVLHGSTDAASCNTPAPLALPTEAAEPVDPSEQLEPGTVDQVDGVPPATTEGAGTGTQGEQVGPSPGLVAPSTTSVTVTKLVHGSDGLQVPISGWQVAAVVTSQDVAAAGEQDPTRTTDASGRAHWTLSHAMASALMAITITEVQRAGFAFVSGACLVMPPAGSPTSTVLTESGASLRDVAPGTTIDCILVSAGKPAMSDALPGADLATPGQQTEASVVGVVPEADGKTSGQSTQPVVGVVPEADGKTSWQPTEVSVVGPVPGVGLATPGQPDEASVVDPVAGADPKERGQPAPRPSAGAGPGPAAGAPQPLTAMQERERAAQRDAAGMATLPVTGGDRETAIIAAAGVLLASLGLVLVRRRRAPEPA